MSNSVDTRLHTNIGKPAPPTWRCRAHRYDDATGPGALDGLTPPPLTTQSTSPIVHPFRCCDWQPSSPPPCWLCHSTPLSFAWRVPGRLDPNSATFLNQLVPTTALDADRMVLWSQQITNDQAVIEKLIAKTSATASAVRWAVGLASAYAALLRGSARSVVAARKTITSVSVQAGRTTPSVNCSVGCLRCGQFGDRHVVAHVLANARDLAGLSAANG